MRANMFCDYQVKAILSLYKYHIRRIMMHEHITEMPLPLGFFSLHQIKQIYWLFEFIQLEDEWMMYDA